MTAVQRPTGPACPGVTETAVRDLAKTLSGSSEIRIRTLHGKGSQYNRLNQRGINLIDVDDTDHGFYAMELRKKAVAHLRGEADDYGKTLTYPLASQVEYWQERWLQTRMTSLSVGPVIKLDPERYRLSSMLDAKKLTPETLNNPENRHGPEFEEAED